MADHFFMTKHKTKLLVIVTLMLGMTAAFVPLVLWTARAATPERSGDDTGNYTVADSVKKPLLLAVNNPSLQAPKLAVSSSVDPVATPVTSDSAFLNARHRFALGMIETANNDDEIGGAGEVSRYQIMPSVWRHYSSSRNYQNPRVSLEVAQQHWTALHTFFQQHAHREPTDFDMYVLWNTRYGYYASKGFNPARLNPVVRDRAQRFVNLIQRGES